MPTFSETLSYCIKLVNVISGLKKISALILYIRVTKLPFDRSTSFCSNSRPKKKGTLNLGSFKLGNALLREFKRRRPGEMLLKLNVPTMIAHGTEDSMVPYRVAYHYASRHPKAKFISVKGAPHGLRMFEKHVFPEVVGWILKHMP